MSTFTPVSQHHDEVPPNGGSSLHGDQSRVAPGEIAIGVIIGRLSEFFDFFVFGIAAVLVFPSVFFPFASAMDGTFYSFAVFSLGFIARPIGSLLFRFIYDWYGRRIVMTTVA